jgi:hypothetical protein
MYVRPPEGLPLTHVELRCQNFPGEMLDHAQAGERRCPAMDADDRNYLLVLPCNAYFAVGYSSMVTRFRGGLP